MFNHPDYRSMGIGKKLVETIINHEQLQDGLMMLKTLDTQGLYQRFGGFGEPRYIERYMEKLN